MNDLPRDFASYLASEARTATSAIHQFRENPYRYSGVHLFVEGDDDGPFYSNQVRQLKGAEAHVYICGGKSQVCLAKLMLKDVEMTNVIFVVDRDHQDFVCEPHDITDVLVTDFYSIESYYVCDEFISRCVSDMLLLPRSNALHHSIVGSFKSSELSFALKMRPLMALVLAIRERSGKVNLNNLNLAKLFKIGNDGRFTVIRSERSSACKSIIVDSGSITFIDLIRWRRRLHSASRLNWLRGKYYAWAVYMYLVLVSSNVARARKSLGLRAGQLPAALDNFGSFMRNGYYPACPEYFRNALSKV